MTELARHIEILLLENDCVIVPDFGGFVAHYTPASWNKKEQRFSPPCRTLGFNPQLTINDGTLVQSYMKAYDTTFADASRIIEREVKHLVDTLHKTGKVELTNVGELRLSINSIYTFVPYDNRITSPTLYGLDTFEIQEVTIEAKVPLKRVVIEKKTTTIPEKRRYELPVNAIKNVAAIAAAIALFFVMSTPVENTYVESGNYAAFAASELFTHMERQSLFIHPIASVTTPEVVNEEPSITKETEEKAETIVTPPETIPNITEPTPAITKPQRTYHLIVGSVLREKDGNEMVDKLKEKGYDNAQIVVGDGKVRISILSYTNRKEAETQLNLLREQESYKNCWLLSVKQPS
ncbi:SPOR domain-containing protein [Bacteroides sp. 214]|uniref:HU domain-containing protein n=1 Tax=Bacteroides sp. 214 TaxID=2302935 RepID=UPI0013D0D52F|nr:SPOR domain-containing protein [Bacteroides sp. 214]NDW12796.1 SPOR domain-containing protein [Bacteroides sp. 214]